MSSFTLADLERIVSERSLADPAESWTAKLVAAGMPKAAKKLGGEAGETVMVTETADLLYHLMVVLRVADVPLGEVMAVLEGRTGQSGLSEKASRTAE